MFNTPRGRLTRPLWLSQELQAQLEEELRSHEESIEEQAAMERRCTLLINDGGETRAALESTERARKALEAELQEAREKHSDLNNQVCVPSRPLGAAVASAENPSRVDDFLNVLSLCSVPVGSQWEKEAGGGSPNSTAGAGGAAGGAKRVHRQVQEGQL